MGRGRPWSLRNRPQALHSTEPDSSRRHSGVVEVWQFWQTGCVRGTPGSVDAIEMEAIARLLGEKKLRVSAITIRGFRVRGGNGGGIRVTCSSWSRWLAWQNFESRRAGKTASRITSSMQNRKMCVMTYWSASCYPRCWHRRHPTCVTQMRSITAPRERPVLNVSLHCVSLEHPQLFRRACIPNWQWWCSGC